MPGSFVASFTAALSWARAGTCDPAPRARAARKPATTKRRVENRGVITSPLAAGQRVRDEVADEGRPFYARPKGLGSRARRRRDGVELANGHPSSAGFRRREASAAIRHGAPVTGAFVDPAIG